MIKLNVAVTIIAISVLPKFLAGCAATDDIARIASRQGSNVGDDLARQVPNKRTAVSTAVSRNADQYELLDRCRRQVGKSAVVVAWDQIQSSGGQVSEQYLLDVARDAVQKCTVGKQGDQVLDELAKLVVSDFKQEYPQAKLE